MSQEKTRIQRMMEQTLVERGASGSAVRVEAEQLIDEIGGIAAQCRRNLTM